MCSKSTYWRVPLGLIESTSAVRQGSLRGFGCFLTSQAAFYMGPSWAPVGPMLGSLIAKTLRDSCCSQEGHTSIIRLISTTWSKSTIRE